MGAPDNFILVIGESDVGKTHYGGQLLKRLMKEDGRVRMDGAATNLEPFQAVMASLDAGVLADHTSTAIYHESRWPVIDRGGRKANLIWPDYGGEQIKNIIDKKRLPHVWLKRITQSSAWLLMIRLQRTQLDSDIISRPLKSLERSSREPSMTSLSDQARLIELLQIFIFAHSKVGRRMGRMPRLIVLLTCWDELQISAKQPIDVLCEWLPMFGDFVESNWDRDSSVIGLSALERALDKEAPDESYIAQGSEQFGYVVLEDGSRSADLTLPIWKLLAEPA